MLDFPINALEQLIPHANRSTITPADAGRILASLAEEGQHEALQLCLSNDYFLQNATYRGNMALQAALKKRNAASESDRFRYEVTINILRAIPSVSDLERIQKETLDRLTSQMSDLNVFENAGEKRKSESSESFTPLKDKKAKTKHASNESGEKGKPGMGNGAPVEHNKRQRCD